MTIVLGVITIILQVATADPGASVVATGKPNYRRPGLTEIVIQNQLKWGRITQEQVDNPALAGYVAVVDCSLIGQHVEIVWPGGAVSGPYLAIDCRGRHLPAIYPGDPWAPAVELDKAEWHRYYDWSLFARREPVTVRLPTLTPCAISCIMQ